MAAKKQITARVLVATVIAGQPFEPNALVKGDAETLEPLIKVGELSSDKAAVEYCSNELKVEVVDLNATVEGAESDTGDNTDSEE